MCRTLRANLRSISVERENIINNTIYTILRYILDLNNNSDRTFIIYMLLNAILDRITQEEEYF